MTGKYRGQAHKVCNINNKQDQSNFIPSIFHNFSNCCCHLFFKKLVDKKGDKLKIKIIPKTTEEKISIRYGCIRFIDSYRFLSSSFDSLVNTLVDNSHKSLKILEEEIVDNDEKINIVSEIKLLIKENMCNYDSNKNLRKDYPDEI